MDWLVHGFIACGLVMVSMGTTILAVSNKRELPVFVLLITGLMLMVPAVVFELTYVEAEAPDKPAEPAADAQSGQQEPGDISSLPEPPVETAPPPAITDTPPEPSTWQECTDDAFGKFKVETERLVTYDGKLTYALGKLEYDMAVCDRMFPEGEAP